MVISKIKEKANGVTSIILSIIVVISFSVAGSIENYSIFSLFFLICVYYLIYKTKFEFNSKAEFGVNMFLSILFSAMFVIGGVAHEYAYDRGVDIIKNIFSLKNLLIFPGAFILIFIILQNLIHYLCKCELTDRKLFEAKNYKIFIYSFFIIMLCWIPYFMAYYPGVLTPDSFSELEAIVYDGIKSDHHPVFHQLFILVFYKIGQLFFTEVNDVVAFINFSQMIILALIFTYTIYFLYKRNVKFLFICIVTAYFALYPSFAYHSFTMWKDVLFGGLVLLFVLSLISLTEKKDSKIEFKNLLAMFLTTILMLLFRNNAIYM